MSEMPFLREGALALISDIHGNFVALQRLLQRLDSQGVQQVVCLGDAAATGPQPRECLDLLAARQIPVIMGNADEWLLHPEVTAPEGSFMRQVEETDRWCAQQLSDDNWRYLRAFAPVLQLETPGGLLCFHGTPRNNREVINATTPVEVLAEIFADHPDRVVAGGHTHQQLLRRVQDRTLINPGSVGLAYEIGRDGQTRNVARADYALLHWIDEELQVALGRMAVDAGEIRSAILESGMPDAEIWAAGWSD